MQHEDSVYECAVNQTAFTIIEDQQLFFLLSIILVEMNGVELNRVLTPAFHSYLYL